MSTSTSEDEEEIRAETSTAGEEIRAGKPRTAKKRAKGKAKRKERKAEKKRKLEEAAANKPPPPPKTVIVKELESCEKFRNSWFRKNKDMIRDFILVLYWGPTWLKEHPRLLNWFIHGAWMIELTMGKKDRDKKRKKTDEDEATDTEEDEATQRKKKRKKPENEAGPSTEPFSKKVKFSKFSKQLQDSMRKHWPEVKKSFWDHEWEKHCKKVKMTQEEYFSTVMDVFYAIKPYLNDLEVGVAMPASEAVRILHTGLGQVQISAHKGQFVKVEGSHKTRFRKVKGADPDTMYVYQLKIRICNQGYGIVSKRGQEPYLPDIETGDDKVMLADRPVEMVKRETIK